MRFVVLHQYTKFEVRIGLAIRKTWRTMCVSFNGPGDLELWPFDLETNAWVASKGDIHIRVHHFVLHTIRRCSLPGGDTILTPKFPIGNGNSSNRAFAPLKGVFIVTQLNSTQLNWTYLNSTELNWPSWTAYSQVSRVFVYDVMTYKQSQLLFTLSSWVQLSSVELCRYKRAFRLHSKFNADRNQRAPLYMRDVGLIMVMTGE